MVHRDAATRRPSTAAEGRWRWSISVTIAFMLHAAAIAGLVASMRPPSPVAPDGNEIEVSLIDPAAKPDEPPPTDTPAEPPVEKTPDPPPIAESRPQAPPPEPPPPPIAEIVPPPATVEQSQPPDVSPPPPDVASQPRPDESAPDPPPAANFGFAIPTGPSLPPSPPEPVPATRPPDTVAIRPKPPETPPAAPVARMAPLVITATAPRDPRLPAYPADARSKGEQGNVLVEVELEPGGSIRGVRLKASSGHRSLDDAALRSARVLRFRPPQPPPGVVLHNAILVEIPFSFRLE